MTFSLIYTDHRYGQTYAQKDVFVNMDSADDYYTKVKGRKFQIPFFDDDYAAAQFTPSNGAILEIPLTSISCLLSKHKPKILRIILSALVC